MAAALRTAHCDRVILTRNSFSYLAELSIVSEIDGANYDKSGQYVVDTGSSSIISLDPSNSTRIGDQCLQR